jgi:biopolymer transport protein ExbD
MKAFDQINVIPFIDIMLVLLTIVLTTASFVSQGLIEVTLPEAETAEVATTSAEGKSVEISVDVNQNIYFSEEKVSKDILEEKLKALKKDTAITLRVDESATFKNFVFIVDLLKKYKLDKLSVLTRKQTGNK